MKNNLKKAVIVSAIELYRKSLSKHKDHNVVSRDFSSKLLQKNRQA